MLSRAFVTICISPLTVDNVQSDKAGDQYGHLELPDECYAVGAFSLWAPASSGDALPLLRLLLLPDGASTASSALATSSITEIGAESPCRQPILMIRV